MRKAHLNVTVFSIDITFTFCSSSKGNLMTAQCVGCDNTSKTVHSNEKIQNSDANSKHNNVDVRIASSATSTISIYQSPHSEFHTSCWNTNYLFRLTSDIRRCFIDLLSLKLYLSPHLAGSSHYFTQWSKWELQQTLIEAHDCSVRIKKPYSFFFFFPKTLPWVTVSCSQPSVHFYGILLASIPANQLCRACDM